jgi:hypothetical protein
LQNEDEEKMIWISKYPPQYAHPSDNWFCERDGLEYYFTSTGWMSGINFIAHPKKFRQLVHGDFND